MREIMHRIFTRQNYFFVFIVILVLIIGFFWKLINPSGFANTINGYMADIWEVFKYLMTLFFLGVGLAIIVGWRPFKKKKG